jgi:CelD/BcsL family acetyltransferase involved in cellulose biosynthesis
MIAGVVERGAAAGLSEQWEELAERAAATPYAHPGWILAWHEAFAPRRRLQPIAVRRAGRLVALVPLVEGRTGLSTPSNWHTPEFELLAEDDMARAELCQQMVERAPHTLALRFLPQASADAIARAAAGARYRVLQRTLLRSPIADIGGRSWEEFQQSVSAGHRADIRRRWRRLNEQGDVSVEVHDGRERLGALLAEGFAVEASGWKGKAGTAILSRPETERFYTRIAEWTAKRGWLRLTFIRLDGRAIAFSFDLEYRNVHHNLKNGYDEALARLSPGKLITALLVERACTSGLERYEFNGAPEPYKLAWATGTTERQVVQAFASTVPGLGHWLAYAAGRPLAKRALELTRRRP